MKASLRPFGTGPAAYRTISVARSHVGKVRTINEDRMFDCPQRHLWAVADGMGGHSGGDLAAQAVVDALHNLGKSDAAIFGASLIAALHNANDVIVEMNRARKGDAGSTVVAAHIDCASYHCKATIAWAGDSRAYLIRRGRVSQLTRDHSLVQDLVDADLLTEHAALSHPQANVITRALGIGTLDLATTTLPVIAGDRLLLCSDGLSRSVGHTAMAAALPIKTLADTLLSEALDRDGSDNISVVLIDIAA